MSAERVLWLGGNQDRHLYYINHIAEKMNVVGGIMQVREHHLPQPMEGLGPVDRANFIQHFQERDEAEAKFFGKQPIPNIPLLKVDKNTLNDTDAIEFIKRVKPDVAIIFGTGMIRPPLTEYLPKDTINLHLGLSPRYRGAATLFWPFYFLEPNFAGTTFHYIEQSPDAGDIIHQVVPKLEKGDGIHDVGAKAVIQSTIEAVALLEMYPNWKTFTQKPEAGKNFLETDFKPQHLRMIYQVYQNNVVDAYLDGKLNGKEPNLKRQF